jgi:hypothetical protein
MPHPPAGAPLGRLQCVLHVAPRRTVVTLAVLLTLMVAVSSAQTGPGGSPIGGAMDDHFRRDAARGEGRPSRAFAFAVEAEAAAVIERVDEQRQLRGNPRFVLTVKSQAAATVPAVEVLAIVVAERGAVTAVQPVPAITDLRRGDTVRREVDLRGVTLGPTDHIAFVIAAIERGPGDRWHVDEATLRGMAVEAARALFPTP